MLRKEWKYSFCSPLCILAGLLAASGWLMGAWSIISGIQEKKDLLANFSSGTFKEEVIKEILGNVNGFAVFKEGMHEFFFPFALVLVVSLLFSGKFIYDKNSSFGNLCITRNGYCAYFWNRVTYTFIGSFIFTFILSMLILAGSLLVFSAKLPDAFFGTDSRFPLMGLFSTKPIVYCLLISVNMSLYTGVFALYGMGASAWISNRFVASLVPTAVFILCTQLPQFIRTEPLRWIDPGNIPGFFGYGGLISDLYSPPVRYLLVWLVFLTPLIITLPILYYKNRKQYIR